MRILRVLVGGVLLLVASAAPTYAQAQPQGATQVFRTGEGWSIWFMWNDYTPTQIAVFSSDPNFLLSSWCDGQDPQPDDEWIYMRMQDVWPAQMKWNGMYKGPMFTRVYDIPDGAPAPDWTTYPCSLLSGREGPIIAEGITEFFQNGVNNYVLGPGENTWGWWAVGQLAAPACKTKGIAKISMAFRYKALSDGSAQPLVVRGPDLTCIGETDK